MRPTRRRAGSAACAASCARAGSPSGRRPPPPRPPPSSRSRCSEAATNGGRQYDVAFRSLAAPGAAAHADLSSGDSGTTLHLWVKGLPKDDNAVYEVLCDAESWTATAGTFRTDSRGKAVVVLTTALRKGDYDAIRIVRRQHAADGRLVRPRHPRGEIVLNFGGRASCDASPGFSRSC